MEKEKAVDKLIPQLVEKTKEELKDNREYRALLDEYINLSHARKYIQASKVKAKMNEMVRRYATKFAEQELETRKSDKKIIEMLEDQADKDKYNDILTGMCMCFDMLDFLINDINALMRRAGTGFVMESLPEIAACKERVSKMVDMELNRMSGDVQEIYTSEVDWIYNKLRDRTSVFRKRVNNLKGEG